jgi:hypothetical protein
LGARGGTRLSRRVGLAPDKNSNRRGGRRLSFVFLKGFGVAPEHISFVELKVKPPGKRLAFLIPRVLQFVWKGGELS